MTAVISRDIIEVDGVDGDWNEGPLVRHENGWRGISIDDMDREMTS